MNTYHGGATDVNGRLTDEAKEKFEQRSGVLFEKAPADGSRPKLGTLQAKYMASREHCLASDQALASVTAASGDVHFLVTKLPGVLGPDEEFLTFRSPTCRQRLPATLWG